MCYNEVYMHGQALKGSIKPKEKGDIEARKFYDRVHPLINDQCQRLGYFKNEETKFYFKEENRDRAENLNIPDTCAYCGRSFITCKKVQTPMMINEVAEV